jgi:hypothetical protein
VTRLPAFAASRRRERAVLIEATLFGGHAGAAYTGDLDLAIMAHGRKPPLRESLLLGF